MGLVADGDDGGSAQQGGCGDGWAGAAEFKAVARSGAKRQGVHTLGWFGSCTAGWLTSELLPQAGCKLRTR